MLARASKQLPKLLLASALLASVPVAQAQDFTLRPSLTGTNYIRVVPSEAFSQQFVGIIQAAIQHAGRVQAASARWHGERYGIDAAYGAQLPSAEIYGETGVASGGDSRFPYSYGVRVSVPVYDGFSAAYATQSQIATAGAAGHAARDELAATLVDLVAAAAAIRRAEDTLAARRAQYSAMQDLLGAIVSERETGTASKVDTDQVEAQLAQIEIEIKAAEAARIQAQESFAGIAGQAPEAIAPIGSIARFLPSSQRAAVDVALAENPQLAQRLDLATAARLATQSVQSSFGPDLSLDFSAGGAGDMRGTVDDHIDARAMFRLSVPFAYGTQSAVQQQALEAQAADFEVNAARTGIVAGIESAYQRLETSRRSLTLAYDALDRAQTVRTGMQTERELGERSIFDLLTAQNAYAEAQIRLASLKYEITVAEHLLAAQMGRIDDIYGVGL